jgi:HYDIN/CFA65/VesB family protein
MNKPLAEPKMLASTILVLLLAAAALIPARALAAPMEGPGSPLTASPSPIVVPTTTSGYNGAALEVEITNPGEEAWIDKVTIEGPEAGEFFTNGSSCSYLGEGQKCGFQFGLKPSSAGLKQATMVVSFQGGRSPESFPVSGQAVEPQLAFTPASHDFGLQRINRDTSSASFQLTNTGAALVQLNNLEIQGDTSVFWTGNNNCWNTLNPGDSCSVEINFNPHELTTYSAQLRAVVNGTAFTASLSGQGGAPVVEALENPFDFGAFTVGSQSSVRTIEIANSGNFPAAFFIAVIAGGDSGSFRLLDENCTAAELMPDSSCTAHVRFAPQGPGPKLARLALFGDGDAGTMVFLEGEGVAPAVTMAPGSFDFGTAVSGTRSSAQTFVVRNDGDTATEMGPVSIVGANLGQFQVTGDECTGVTLGSGGECLVRVRFTPTSSGAKVATLRIDGEGGAHTAALSGQGNPRKKKARGGHAPRRIGLFSQQIANR